MNLLKIFGAVVAVHLLAFIFIFTSPGCSSGPRTMPTPDATVPAGSAATPAVSYNSAAPQPVDLGTAPTVSYTPASPLGHATPTRPGSAAAVAVTPSQPVENVAPVSTYTVERGDSLWSIAKKNGLTVAELAKANSISSGTALRPGRKLIIPGKAGAAKSPAGDMTAVQPLEKATAITRATNGEKLTHTVAVGETLGAIARKYGVRVAQLVEENTITDPSKVRAGQVLVIPGGKAAAAKPAAPVAAPIATEPVTTPPPAAPKFELTPPPPGQDLDSGLKGGETQVPTIKVEDPAPQAN